MKNLEKELDKIKTGVRDLKKEPLEIYIPERPEERKVIKKLWEEYSPKEWYEKIWMSTAPGSYLLWKLPEDQHKKLNKILDYIAVALANVGAPNLALVSGVVDGTSQLIYGLKTKNKDSGKHLSGGLAKIIDSAEKIEDKNIKNLAKIIRKFIEDDLLEVN